MSPLLAALLVALWAVAVPPAQCTTGQQQQQQPAVGVHITPDELLRLIDQAVAAAIQPFTSKLDSRIDTLDTRLDTLDSRVDTLDSRVDTLDSRVDTLDSRLDVVDARVDGITEHQHKHDSELASVNGSLDNHSSLLEEKAKQLDNHETQLQGQGSRLDSQKSRLDAVASQIDSHNSRLEEHASRLSDHNSRVVGQASQIDSQKLRLDNHTSQIGTHKSRLDGHTSQIDIQKSQLETVLSRTEIQQARIDGVTIRLDSLQTPSDHHDVPARDCSDLPAGSHSGVHLLQPGLDGTVRVPAYCDLDTDGGNWTVVQRRANIQPRQEFYLGWAAYKEGFGELDAELWWGLEHLWTMTAPRDRRYELRINLEDFDGGKRYAVYRGFRISSEEDGYRLTAGNYTGDAGDSLKIHIGQRFTTKDRDQDDTASINCASHGSRKAGWWYSNCGPSNLNGRYLIGENDNQGGLFWGDWRGYHYSLKNVEMKIRPTGKLQED